MKRTGLIAQTMSAFLLMGFSTQANARAVSQTLLAEHVIAQQGLGLGLSSTSFWTQLVLLIEPEFLPQNTCSALSSGGRSGAIDVLSFHNGKKKYSTTANFYFDSACKKPYIAASSKYVTVSKSKETSGTIHSTYTGVTGFALGKYDVSVELVQKASDDFQVWGVGTFAVSKTTVASIGFACEVRVVTDSPASSSNPAIPCTYSLAQKFPSLKQSLAFVTKLKLKGNPSSSKDPVKFEGEQSQTVTSPNNLTVISPAAYALAISGSQQTTYGSAAPQGSSSNFSLFPAKPTLWSITDAAHDIALSTAVTDNKTRGSKGTITTISTGKTLATFTVDQSGTGSIKYSDGSTAAITSWILSN